MKQRATVGALSKKVSANATGPVILNRGFRWARAALRWVHLTRDDHACGAMYQARARMSIGSRKYKARRLRRRSDCRGCKPAL